MSLHSILYTAKFHSQLYTRQSFMYINCTTINVSFIRQQLRTMLTSEFTSISVNSSRSTVHQVTQITQ